MLRKMAIAITLVAATPALADPAVTLLDTTGCNLSTTGCKYSGNAQAGNAGAIASQYNFYYNPDITLNYLGSTPSGGYTATGSTGGTFSVPTGVNVQYFAVKAGNEFVLYKYTGANSWSTARLTNKNGTLRELSHIAFYGNAVPEPATWGMMILGFGVAGGTMRRRRALGAAAA